MNPFTRMALLGALAFLSQSARADLGPYYVTYPGYCNVVKIYVNPVADIYGTEIGCPALLGNPFVGTILGDGRVMVSTTRANAVCINVYWPNGSLVGGCSTGGPIAYPPTSTFNVYQSVPQDPPAAKYRVSTEVPDMDKTKDLPERP